MDFNISLIVCPSDAITTFKPIGRGAESTQSGNVKGRSSIWAKRLSTRERLQVPLAASRGRQLRARGTGGLARVRPTFSPAAGGSRSWRAQNFQEETEAVPIPPLERANRAGTRNPQERWRKDQRSSSYRWNTRNARMRASWHGPGRQTNGLSHFRTSLVRAVRIALKAENKPKDKPASKPEANKENG